MNRKVKMQANEEALVKQIREQLQPIDRDDSPKHTSLRPAAVLVPFFFDENIWKILFIRRSDYGEFHRGEVAFPGGSRETEDDNIAQTALRETQEELGILPKYIRPIGLMQPMETISNYLVTPIVGFLEWPTQIVLNTVEVARVFSIPLQWLMNKNNWSQKEFETQNRGRISTIVYDNYDNEKLWGFTAKVVQNLIELLKTEER
jgi:8-oxo-dGTP pyrophosphatase MutT (NUDIX family)